MKNMLNKIEIELNTFTHTHTNKCIKWHWSESFESFIHNRTFNVLFCFSTNTRKWFAQELLQFYYQFTTYLKKNWFYILRINVSCFNNISITFCCFEIRKKERQLNILPKWCFIEVCFCWITILYLQYPIHNLLLLLPSLLSKDIISSSLLLIFFSTQVEQMLPYKSWVVEIVFNKKKHDNNEIDNFQKGNIYSQYVLCMFANLI